MFASDSGELEAYLSLPRNKRTAVARNEAYAASYKRLIRYWESFRKRNQDKDPDTFVMDRVGTINGVIAELKLKLAQFQ